MFQPVGFPTSKALYASADIGVLPISYQGPICWPISGWRHVAKRGFDVVVSLLALAAPALPMLVAALIIWRDSPGPALFTQRRIGRGGIGFVMWKFRTMQEHAPEVN